MHDLERVSVLTPSGTIADANWKARSVGDFSDDGRPDSVFHHQVDDTIVLWLMAATRRPTVNCRRLADRRHRGPERRRQRRPDLAGLVCHLSAGVGRARGVRGNASDIARRRRQAVVTRTGSLWALGAVLLSVPLTAQQPHVRQSFAGAAEPVGPAAEWALASEGPTARVRARLQAHGPATRLTPSTDLTLVRPQWTLQGSFSVSALFERLPGARATAAYGLTLGCTDQQPLALAFLIRPTGAMGIQRGVTATRWSPIPAPIPPRRRGTLDPDAAPASVDRLEVRVRDGDATFLVNGQAVAVVPIHLGELDGYAGVHAAAGSAVQVSGFTLEGAVTAVALPMPRGGGQ